MIEATDLAEWGPPPESYRLAASEVHIWRVRLDCAAFVSSLVTLLSSDETGRMQRYKDERDRRRFIAARGILRVLLARYLRVSASNVELDYGLNGKPHVADNGGVPMFFNISHSGDWALMAFTAGGEVGVDVEEMKAGVDFVGVAALFLSEEERAELQQRPPSARADGFYRYWVCKEAYLKARGTGITIPPRGFSMSIACSAPTLLRASQCDPHPENWLFSWIDVGPEVRAAIACASFPQRPLQYQLYDFIAPP